METFPGRYHDGWTARNHAVEVTFRPAGLEIRDAVGGLLALWPLDQVHLTEKADARSEARLRRGYDEPARLVISGEAVLAALEAACPNLTRTEPSGWRSWKPVALWGSGAVLSVVLLVTVFIPALATQVAANLPDGWRARIGQETREQIVALLARAERLDGASVVCGGEQGLRALQSLVDALLQGTDDPPPITLTVLDVGVANALALPGGQVLVLRGLIEKAAEPNALSGVVAHELGHVLERHPLTVAIERASTAVVLGLLLGDAVGGTLIAGTGQVLIGNAYSREAEREADRIGLELMRQAGFDARPFGPFMETLGDGGHPLFAAFLSTHPPSRERAAAIERDASPGGPALSDRDWQAVQAVCD